MMSASDSSILFKTRGRSSDCGPWRGPRRDVGMAFPKDGSNVVDIGNDGIDRSGTLMNETVVPDTFSWAAFSAAFKRISLLPFGDPQAKPRICMVEGES